MKKVSLVLMALLLINGVAYTQDFRFGIKGSANISWMKPDVDIKESAVLKQIYNEAVKYQQDGMTFRFTYGLIGEFSLSDNYSFVTGLNIAYAGGKLSFPHADSVETSSGTTRENGMLSREYNIQYIELPLMLKMKTNEIAGFTYFAQFGFGTGFLIEAVGQDEFEFSSNKLTEEDVDIRKKISFLKEALLIGAGFEYALSDNVSALVGLTFNNGFTNVLSGNNAVDTEIKEKAIANYIEINLGFLF